VLAAKRLGRLEEQKQFFFEKKNQKTFAFDAIPVVSAMTSTLPQAQSQKSFGSFLQKRTASFPKLLSLLDFFPNKHSPFGA
jgi:hypothetical protein